MMKNRKELNLISDERRTYDLQSAAKVFMPLAKALLGKKKFVEVDLLSSWSEIVGYDVASYSFPKQLVRGKNKEGYLIVEVPSGAFALELQLKEKNLVERINTFFGNSVVNKIRVVQNAEVPITTNEEDSKPKNLVTTEECVYIQELSKGVRNEKLQKALADLGRFVICANKEETKDDV